MIIMFNILLPISYKFEWKFFCNDNIKFNSSSEIVIFIKSILFLSKAFLFFILSRNFFDNKYLWKIEIYLVSYSSCKNRIKVFWIICFTTIRFIFDISFSLFNFHKIIKKTFKSYFCKNLSYCKNILMHIGNNCRKNIILFIMKHIRHIKSFQRSLPVYTLVALVTFSIRHSVNHVHVRIDICIIFAL